MYQINYLYFYSCSACGLHKSPLQLVNTENGATTGMTRSIGTPLASTACIAEPTTRNIVIPRGSKARIVVSIMYSVCSLVDKNGADNVLMYART